MIRIPRSDKVPSSLKRSGERQTRLDCDAYDACPNDYCSGKESFQKREYYSKKHVKDLLVKMHNSKCCYCERKLWPSYLHVEHFRPRYGVRQALDQRSDDLPGYYWLAYRWENLLLACLDCNSKFKRTFFPLVNPTERARSHHDDIGNESPLFVDPVGEDPRIHIRFDCDAPEGLTPQGRMTIDGIGLRRESLKQDRLAKIAEIETLYAFLELAAENPGIAKLQAKAKEARERIEAAKQPEAEFSSMVRDYVERLAL
jgi:5-methylcytosine-specific restriction endonuclease McrA